MLQAQATHHVNVPYLLRVKYSLNLFLPPLFSKQGLWQLLLLLFPIQVPFSRRRQVQCSASTARMGVEVWMGQTRRTPHRRKKKVLKPDQTIDTPILVDVADVDVDT